MKDDLRIFHFEPITKIKISLDVEQLDGLNDVNIVKRYFQDMFQETLCDEDIQLLQEGLSMLEEV